MDVSADMLWCLSRRGLQHRRHYKQNKKQVGTDRGQVRASVVVGHGEYSLLLVLNVLPIYTHFTCSYHSDIEIFVTKESPITSENEEKKLPSDI